MITFKPTPLAFGLLLLPIFSTAYIWLSALFFWGHYVYWAGQGATPPAPGVVIGLYSVGTGLMALVLIVGWVWGLRTRLIFSDTHFIIHNAWPFPSQAYAYADIKYVTCAGYGQPFFKTRTGQTFMLDTFNWLAPPGTTLVQTLQHHLPMGRFAPNFVQRIRTRQLADGGFGLLLGLYAILAGVAFGVYPLLHLQFTWQRHYGASIFWGGYGRVQAVSVGADGNPRWITQDELSAKWFTVWQQTPQGARTWAIGPADLGTLSYFRLQGVVFDAHQRPQVLFPDGQMLAWDGAAWHIQPTPLGHWREVVIREPHVWAISDRSPYSLLYWNTSLNVTTTVPLPITPAAPTALPVALTTAPNDQLLVLAQQDQTRLLLRRPLALTLPAQAEWETLVTWSKTEDESIRALAQAPNGDVWLWVEASDASESHLQHYEAATTTWHTYPLPTAICCGYLGPEGFFVDGYHRVWVKKEGQIMVLAAASSPPLQLLALYTEGNANAAGYGGSLVPGPDGRLWTYNQMLVWADTNSPQLPWAVPTPWRSYVDLLWGGALIVGLLLVASLVRLLRVRALRAELAQH